MPTLKEVQNTDREIFRLSDSEYAPSIHVTSENGIGINVGGHVFVKPVDEWHRLALAAQQGAQEPATSLSDAEILDALREIDDLIEDCENGIPLWNSNVNDSMIAVIRKLLATGSK